MVLDDEMKETKSFFESHNIKLSDFWLEKCVEWTREKFQNYKLKTLHTQIYEQWLLLDLRDVEVQTLPPNLSGQIKTILTGKFSLQLMSAVDISKPKLQQINQIRNKKPSRVVEQEYGVAPPPKRMLLLTLSDGMQEVQAMEFKPIPQLNLNMSPGMKVKIIGPVTVRRGQMLLESKNVELLGGEVEELIVSNAAENILAQALNLPINPTPLVIEESFEMANRDLLNANQSIRNNFGNQSNRNNQENLTSWKNNTNTSSNKNMCNQNLSNITTTSNNKATSKNARTNRNAGNNAGQIKNSSQSIASMFSKITTSQKPALNIPNEVEIDLAGFGDDHDDDLFVKAEAIVLNSCLSQQENKPSIASTSGFGNAIGHRRPEMTPQARSSTPNLYDDMDIDSELLEKIDIHVAEVTSPPQEVKYTTPVAKPPSQKIQPQPKQLPQRQDLRLMCELEGLRSSVTKGKFKVHARFKRVVEKLAVTPEEYKLKIVIEDDTAELQVRMHSEVISELIGYCPAAMEKLKSDIAKKDACAVETALKAMSIFKEKMVSLDCVMEILLEKSKDPYITKIFQ